MWAAMPALAVMPPVAALAGGAIDDGLLEQFRRRQIPGGTFQHVREGEHMEGVPPTAPHLHGQALILRQGFQRCAIVANGPDEHRIEPRRLLAGFSARVTRFAVVLQPLTHHMHLRVLIPQIGPQGFVLGAERLLFGAQLLKGRLALVIQGCLAPQLADLAAQLTPLPMQLAAFFAQRLERFRVNGPKGNLQIHQDVAHHAGHRHGHVAVGVDLHHPVIRTEPAPSQRHIDQHPLPGKVAHLHVAHPRVGPFGIPQGGGEHLLHDAHLALQGVEVFGGLRGDSAGRAGREQGKDEVSHGRFSRGLFNPPTKCTKSFSRRSP